MEVTTSRAALATGLFLVGSGLARADMGIGPIEYGVLGVMSLLMGGGLAALAFLLVGLVLPADRKPTQRTLLTTGLVLGGVVFAVFVVSDQENRRQKQRFMEEMRERLQRERESARPAAPSPAPR